MFPCVDSSSPVKRLFQNCFFSCLSNTSFGVEKGNGNIYSQSKGCGFRKFIGAMPPSSRRLHHICKSPFLTIKCSLQISLRQKNCQLTLPRISLHDCHVRPSCTQELLPAAPSQTELETRAAEMAQGSKLPQGPQCPKGLITPNSSRCGGLTVKINQQ